jgi:excisionase family DNA binding protein
MTHHTKRPPIEPKRVYSREEVAELLNVSLSTVKRLIAARRLRASQPPGMRRVLILGQHILDLLEVSEINPERRPESKDDNPQADQR